MEVVRAHYLYYTVLEYSSDSPARSQIVRFDQGTRTQRVRIKLTITSVHFESYAKITLVVTQGLH